MGYWWEKYGLFIPGKWTYLDDLLVFTMFLGGIVMFTIYSIYYDVLPDMRIFSVYGILLWMMLAVYILGINKE